MTGAHWQRRKVAKGRNRVKNIRLRNRRGSRRGTAGARAKATVEAARHQKQRFVYLKLRGDREGIFEVQRRSIRMVHRVMRENLRVKASPWLQPAVAQSRRLAPKVFKQELERHVQQKGTFR